MKRATRLTLVPLLLSFVMGCGYQSPNHPQAGSAGSYCVESGPEHAIHPQASTHLLFGAKDALGANGKLAKCSEAQRFVVQVVDVRFEPEGVVSGAEPTARATRVTVTATGSVSDRDVGMVEEEAVVATGDTPLSEKNAHDVGVVMAAKRAGESLVRRLLGEAVPGSAP